MNGAAFTTKAAIGVARRRRLSLPPARFLAIAWAAWSIVQIRAGSPRIASGDLGDTDNYMRLVEWRDFLAGQDWFDLRQHRFIGPDGGDMHFSRIPDAMMSALHWLFAPLVGGGAAEQIVLLAHPLLLLLGFLAAAMIAARRIAGDRAGIAAIVLAILAPPVIQQFAPGRIDHHGLALVLSMSAFLATLYALIRPHFAVVTALAAALAVAVSLETAPVAAAAFLVFGLQWINSGDVKSLRLIGYAMAIAAPAILFATAGPASRLDMHCDAFAAPAAFALMGAGVVAIVLSCLRLGSAPARFAAAAFGCVALGGAFAFNFGDCLAGPFGGMDPLVRDVWLRGVGEARTPIDLLRHDLRALIGFYGFPLAGLIVGALLMRSATKAERMTLGAALIFLAATSIELLGALRGATLSTAFAIIPFAAAVGRASQSMIIFPPKKVAAFLSFCLLAFPASYYAIGNMAGDALHYPRAQSASNCDEARMLQSLRALPPSLVFTPIDLGPAILAQTSHSVTAAPYHRNDLSMRRAIEFFTADDAAAHAAFDQSGAEFVVFCPSSGEAGVYRGISPKGLAARLEQGGVPDWLTPVEIEGAAPIRIYRRRTG